MPQGQQVDGRLHALRDLGFHFTTNHDGGGLIVALVAFRAHHGVVDIVLVRGEYEADAIRIPDDDPDALAPDAMIWRTTGTTSDVLDRLLALPDPVRRGQELTG